MGCGSNSQRAVEARTAMKRDDENARTIFHAQALVKIFCKILCRGGENAGEAHSRQTRRFYSVAGGASIPPDSRVG